MTIEQNVQEASRLAVALWGALRAAGAAPGRIRNWGRLFDLGN